MTTIDLRVCDLHTGDRTIKSFPSEEAAVAWLKDRPRFQQVLGVAMMDLAPEIDARLRAALRPLDDEEQARQTALEAELAAAARAKAEEAARREEAAAAAQRAAQAAAPPDRPMEIRYRYDRGQELELVDPHDAREITPEAREAVLAFVAEREEWVRDRGQVVGEAKVTVYPGALPPAAKGERVRSGSFVPVTAPARPAGSN